MSTVPFNRREFLAGAAAAALPLALSPSGALAQSEGGAAPVQVSLMMWTYNVKNKTMAEKIASVKPLGIDAVELVNTLKAKDNAEVAAKIEEVGLKVANVSAGTEMYGPKAALTNPSERAAVLENLRESVKIARLYKTDTLLALSGRLFPDIAKDEQRKSLVDGLKSMMEIVEGEGMRMIIEPLNRFDHRGYYLTSMYEAFDIIKEVGSPKLTILFDIYHTQMEEGNLIKRIQDNIDLIGHFHVADAPGRHQPGTGEINYANVYSAIKKTGYKGYIGLEFIGQGDMDREIIAQREKVLKDWAAA